MQRLKTRPQFQAAMAGGTVSRTAHFALHRLVLGADGTANAGSAVATSGPGASEAAPAAVVAAASASSASSSSVLPTAAAAPQGHGASPQALFALPGVWLGAMVPKRWARRAVTRNTIKRQIYTVGATFEQRLALVAPQSAHVVRLRSTFDRKQFVSATSDQLKQAVRAELLQLFGHAAKRPGPGGMQGGAGARNNTGGSGKSPSGSRMSAVAP